MIRLTAKRTIGIKQGYWSPAKKEDIVQLLGKYEDTGLTPEEVEELESTVKDLKEYINELGGGNNG